MAWSTEVKLLLLDGGGPNQWPMAEARLFDHELFEGVPIEDVLREAWDFHTGATWKIEFQQGPSWPADPNGTIHDIALIVEDAAPTAFNGLWFRTTALQELPPSTLVDPGNYLEIVLSGPIFLAITATQPAPSVPAGEPPPRVMEKLFAEHLPMGLDGNNKPIPAGSSTPAVTTIETATLTPEAGTAQSGPLITAVFTGATRQGPGGASVEFILTLPLVIGPTQYPLDLARVIDVQQAQGTKVTLEAIPTNTTFDSMLKAALAEAFSGVILETLVPEMLNDLSNELSAAVMEQGAAVFGNQKTLPNGVVLTCRDLVIDKNEIVVHVALGAFGGVLDKLPKSSGTVSCPITLLAIMYPALLDLALLRAGRAALGTIPAGRELVAVYDRHRLELTRLLARDRVLAHDTARWLARAQAAPLDDRSSLARVVEDARSLARRFASGASERLAADIETLARRDLAEISWT